MRNVWWQRLQAFASASAAAAAAAAGKILGQAKNVRPALPAAQQAGAKPEPRYRKQQRGKTDAELRSLARAETVVASSDPAKVAAAAVRAARTLDMRRYRQRRRARELAAKKSL